jgi:hypothetical protein
MRHPPIDKGARGDKAALVATVRQSRNVPMNSILRAATICACMMSGRALFSMSFRVFVSTISS